MVLSLPPDEIRRCDVNTANFRGGYVVFSLPPDEISWDKVGVTTTYPHM